jgi:hypothetical protein
MFLSTPPPTPYPRENKEILLAIFVYKFSGKFPGSHGAGAEVRFSARRGKIWKKQRQFMSGESSVHI